MTGHTSEEKLKILYEDSLRDIRGLVRSMEAISGAITEAAELMGRGKSIIRAENERILLCAVNEIKLAVSQVVIARDNLNETAASTARLMMTGDNGPIKQLDGLVKRQHEALGWLNRAARFYEHSFVTRPMVWALVLGGLCGGLGGGIVGSIFVRWYL